MKKLQLKAYAKINLGLDVLGKLPNGYHTVKMIMQSVGIYDVLTFEETDSDIVVTTNEQELPTDENNLIHKAAKIMFDTYHIPGGIRIHLEKNIPIAAGMAGGSTDAAATLKGISRMYGLDVPTEELMKLALPIGADVPYCVLGGTALSEGIGEALTPLIPAPNCYLLVVKPDINVSTKYVYEHFDSIPEHNHPDIDGMVSAIETGSLQGILDRLGNVLEDVTIKAYPVITDIKNKMLDFGAAGTLMSGSGPTVFGIFLNEISAKEAYEGFQKETDFKQVFLTSFV